MSHDGMSREEYEEYQKQVVEESKSETLLKALAIQAHSIQEVFHNVVNSSEY